MTNLNKIIEKIEKFAPPELASDWDNSGWQVYLGNNSVSKILLALTCTIDIVEQAIKNNCNLIISHHPLIFEKINNISTENNAILPVIKAIQNNIQVYSAHTNLDSAQGGIADKLAELLDLKDIMFLVQIPEDFRLGRVGELEKEKELNIFIKELKEILKIDKIKLINHSNKTKVKKIAVIPGSGTSFIPKIKDIDVLITGDVKYHNALDAKDFIVLDAGHFETERIILPVLKDLLNEFSIEALIAEENPPWTIL
ncbi:MAG: Nif3-like dinuclear metal center hexameric protein [Candidatus Melainabacteria bacterium GWA2_34_9]|nr:MAG: Nif3-like dinuclear metal center hexameric protein [Candidatus Melainabacteria bacterium GWA2_34_9]